LDTPGSGYLHHPCLRAPKSRYNFWRYCQHFYRGYFDICS
jgi:hypothetical protein